jgi:hypothetical protein
VSKRVKRLVQAARALEAEATTRSGNDEPLWLVPAERIDGLSEALEAFSDIPNNLPPPTWCEMSGCPFVGATSYRMVSEETGEFFCDVDDMPMALCPEHFREMLEEGLERAEQEISEMKNSLLCDIAESGVEFDDERIPYLLVQIDREVWEKTQRFRAVQDEKTC